MRARVIGLSGPDGSGKSSLAGHLVGRLRREGLPARGVYLYGCAACRRWGPGPGSGGPEASGARPAPRRLHALVDAADLRARLALACWRARAEHRLHASRWAGGPVVVTDRSPLDGLVRFDPPPRSRAWRWYAGAAARFEVIACLDAPAEVLAARDAEHGPAELEDLRRRFRARAASLPNAVVVDVTGRGPGEVARLVVPAGPSVPGAGGPMPLRNGPGYNSESKKARF